MRTIEATSHLRNILGATRRRSPLFLLALLVVISACGYSAHLPPRCPCISPKGMGHTTLGCFCHNGGCPQTYDQAMRTVTASCGNEHFSVVRRVGCGQVEISTTRGLNGDAWIFRETDEALIGASYFSDYLTMGCNDHPSSAGAEVCQTAESCLICGPPVGDLKPCPGFASNASPTKL